MTWANRITIFRIFLVPLFIGCILYYGQVDDAASQPDERWRYAALVIFAVAAISDAVDGFLARVFHQYTPLGAILDPLADKLLLLSSLIVLSFFKLEHFPRFPLWFALIVISRDVMLVTGTFIFHYLDRPVNVQSHWTGKASTFVLCVAILSFLLRLSWWHLACWIGAVFTLLSMMVYLREGIRQLHLSGHTQTFSAWPRV